MAISFSNIIPAKFIELVSTVQYTSPLDPLSSTIITVLDDFVVVNNGSVSANLSMWLVPAGGTPIDANRFVVEVPIAPGDPAYFCQELVGQILLAGGSVWARASVVNTLSLRASGRIISR